MIEEWTSKGLTARTSGGTAGDVIEPRPRGEEIMIGAEAAWALLKRPTDKTSLKFKGTTRAVQSIAFHPDGDRLALGRCTFDMTGKIVRKNAVDVLVASFADGERLLTADPVRSAPHRRLEWEGARRGRDPGPRRGRGRGVPRDVGGGRGVRVRGR
jgi:hypothetical protein